MAVPATVLSRISASSKQATVVLQEWRNSQVKERNNGGTERSAATTRSLEESRGKRLGDCMLVAKRVPPKQQSKHGPAVDCLNLEAEGPTVVSNVPMGVQPSSRPASRSPSSLANRPAMFVFSRFKNQECLRRIGKKGGSLQWMLGILHRIAHPQRYS